MIANARQILPRSNQRGIQADRLLEIASCQSKFALTGENGASRIEQFGVMRLSCKRCGGNLKRLRLFSLLEQAADLR